MADPEQDIKNEFESYQAQHGQEDPYKEIRQHVRTTPSTPLSFSATTGGPVGGEPIEARTEEDEYRAAGRTWISSVPLNTLVELPSMLSALGHAASDLHMGNPNIEGPLETYKEVRTRILKSSDFLSQTENFRNRQMQIGKNKGMIAELASLDLPVSKGFKLGALAAKHSTEMHHAVMFLMFGTGGPGFKKFTQLADNAESTEGVFVQTMRNRATDAQGYGYRFQESFEGAHAYQVMGSREMGRSLKERFYVQDGLFSKTPWEQADDPVADDVRRVLEQHYDYDSTNNGLDLIASAKDELIGDMRHAADVGDEVRRRELSEAIVLLEDIKGRRITIEANHPGVQMDITLDIQKDDLLDFSNPLDGQSEYIQTSLKKITSDPKMKKAKKAIDENRSGREIYNAIGEDLARADPDIPNAPGIEWHRLASEYLSALDIPGHQFPAASGDNISTGAIRGEIPLSTETDMYGGHVNIPQDVNIYPGFEDSIYVDKINGVDADEAVLAAKKNMTVGIINVEPELNNHPRGAQSGGLFHAEAYRKLGYEDGWAPGFAEGHIDEYDKWLTRDEGTERLAEELTAARIGGEWTNFNDLAGNDPRRRLPDGSPNLEWLEQNEQWELVEEFTAGGTGRHAYELDSFDSLTLQTGDTGRRGRLAHSALEESRAINDRRHEVRNNYFEAQHQQRIQESNAAGAIIEQAWKEAEAAAPKWVGGGGRYNNGEFEVRRQGGYWQLRDGNGELLGEHKLMREAKTKVLQLIMERGDLGDVAF